MKPMRVMAKDMAKRNSESYLRRKFKFKLLELLIRSKRFRVSICLRNIVSFTFSISEIFINHYLVLYLHNEYNEAIIPPHIRFRTKI